MSNWRVQLESLSPATGPAGTPPPPGRVGDAVVCAPQGWGAPPAASARRPKAKPTAAPPSDRRRRRQAPCQGGGDDGTHPAGGDGNGAGQPWPAGGGSRIRCVLHTGSGRCPAAHTGSSLFSAALSQRPAVAASFRECATGPSLYLAAMPCALGPFGQKVHLQRSRPPRARRLTRSAGSRSPARTWRCSAPRAAPGRLTFQQP